MPTPARFTIRAASALTGINPNTLRAWERRYGLVVPERTPKGYRLYTQDDVQRLRRIQTALQQGMSVGRVSEYLAALEAAGTPVEAAAPPLPAAPDRSRMVEVSLANAGLSGTTTIRLPAGRRERSFGSSLAGFSEHIEHAALRFDRPAVERAFTRAVGLHSLRQAFTHALAPALKRVGERYLRDLGSVAEEHFLAAIAREKLAAALAGLRPLHQQPRVMCACAPGERHEIALMLLALEVGLEGLSTLYLGADVPLEGTVHAAEASRCHVVALSCTIRFPHETLLELRRRLDHLPRRVALMVGGPASEPHAAWCVANGITHLPLDPVAAAGVVVAAVRRR